MARAERRDIVYVLCAVLVGTEHGGDTMASRIRIELDEVLSTRPITIS